MGDLPILRTSERSAFKRCPQRWWWEYREGLTPKGGKQADALWLGIGIHEALAQWYKKGKRRGRHPAETFAAWAGDEIAYAKTYLDDTYDEPVWEDATELGIAMLDAYAEQWGKDSQWSVIETERPFKIRITKQGKPVAYFASRWDGVIRDEEDGRVYLLEHKTASQISLAYLALDDQAGAYWAVASTILRAEGVLKPGEEIAGITYNFLRKCKPDERPQDDSGMRLNKDGTVSKKQPPPAFVRTVIERSPSEQRSQLRRLSDEVTIMNGMRDGSIPVIKNTSRDCTFCQFFDMCQLHERGGTAWKSIASSAYEHRDPYADTLKSASG